MDINSTHVYNAGPQTVAAMMMDPAWLEEVARRSGATAYSASVDGTVTTMNLELPAPSLAQKFVGSSLSITQVISWSDAAEDGSRSGTLSVDVHGLPADINGTATRAGAGDGTTTVSYRGTLKVKIPLVGGKLEQMASPFITDAIDEQQIVGNEYLAAHPQG